MKNYAIGMMGVIFVFLGSIIYKQQHTMVCYHFPVPESLIKRSEEGTFYLFLFFSKNDCTQCLLEMVEVLNKLPPQFCPAGVVPGEELKNESELRRLTGASFSLYSFREYKKYLPWYTPTLFGVSPAGKIIFVLPGIPGQNSNLKNTLESIYGKLYPSLEKESIPLDGSSNKYYRE